MKIKAIHKHLLNNPSKLKAPQKIKKYWLNRLLRAREIQDSKKKKNPLKNQNQRQLSIDKIQMVPKREIRL